MIQNELFDHVNSNGKDWDDRYKTAGYQCAVQGNGSTRNGGECIARVASDGPPSVADVAVGGVARLRQDTRAGGMLAEYWNVHGAGVAPDPTASNTRTFVTENFG